MVASLNVTRTRVELRVRLSPDSTRDKSIQMTQTRTLTFFDGTRTEVTEGFVRFGESKLVLTVHKTSLTWCGTSHPCLNLLTTCGRCSARPGVGSRGITVFSQNLYSLKLFHCSSYSQLVKRSKERCCALST